VTKLVSIVSDGNGRDCGQGIAGGIIKGFYLIKGIDQQKGVVIIISFELIVNTF